MINIQNRFDAKRIVIVADRNLLEAAANREDPERNEGIGWIVRLGNPAREKLLKTHRLEPSLFVERGFAEITSPEDYPGERLILCLDPLLAEKRREERHGVVIVGMDLHEDVQSLRPSGVGHVVVEDVGLHRRDARVRPLDPTIVVFKPALDAVHPAAPLDGFSVLVQQLRLDENGRNHVRRKHVSRAGVGQADCRNGPARNGLLPPGD